MTGYNSILPPINGDFNFNSCTANYNSILKLFPEIDQIKNVPGYSTETFIGVASVYYALHFWNIESQPILLSQNINVTCNKNFSEVKNQYPSTSKLDNQCANSTYINSIVFDSLAMGESQLTAVEKINNTTLSWTLGYALMRN